MEKIIYTVGYRQPGAEEHLARLTERGFPLVDIRYRAGSRYKPDYNLSRLARRFPDRYYHVRELGNINYQDRGNGILLADVEVGLHKVMGIVEEKPGAILLCACVDWRSCHRRQVADLLKKRLILANVRHLETDGALVAETIDKRYKHLFHRLFMQYSTRQDHDRDRLVYKCEGQIYPVSFLHLDELGVTLNADGELLRCPWQHEESIDELYTSLFWQPLPSGHEAIEMEYDEQSARIIAPAGAVPRSLSPLE